MGRVLQRYLQPHRLQDWTLHEGRGASGVGDASESQQGEGRLTLITRYGAGKVEDMLPTHIEAVKATGIPVVWQCDAVHGNGIVAASNKMKTRYMDDIVAEIVQCIECTGDAEAFS